jgi:dCMP deaminase
MNDRPSRNKVLMDTARLWGERSTCSRLHVGCVIARDSRILTTGYNGAPAGMEHCNHDCNCDRLLAEASNAHEHGCPSTLPCTRAVHAEANAIAFAARYGLILQDASLYTTHMPCPNCCMLIVNAGIKAVVWEIDYRDLSGLQILEEGKVAFGRYRPGKSLDDMMNHD